MNTKDNGRTADDGRRKEGHDAALRRPAAHGVETPRRSTASARRIGRAAHRRSRRRHMQRSVRIAFA
ncbi:hypothetical protein [Burkholderia pseudomallei]|uniref:hypothetical protein n=1 Tax=Burkholderia pseudomallei TaxID=28450 RepID=UPI0018A23083|nr:hypothetical protein [Burkholderia pseudomallei]